MVPCLKINRYTFRISNIIMFLFLLTGVVPIVIGGATWIFTENRQNFASIRKIENDRIREVSLGLHNAVDDVRERIHAKYKDDEPTLKIAAKEASKNLLLVIESIHTSIAKDITNPEEQKAVVMETINKINSQKSSNEIYIFDRNGQCRIQPNNNNINGVHDNGTDKILNTGMRFIDEIVSKGSLLIKWHSTDSGPNPKTLMSSYSYYAPLDMVIGITIVQAKWIKTRQKELLKSFKKAHLLSRQEHAPIIILDETNRIIKGAEYYHSEIDLNELTKKNPGKEVIITDDDVILIQPAEAYGWKILIHYDLTKIHSRAAEQIAEKENILAAKTNFTIIACLSLIILSYLSSQFIRVILNKYFKKLLHEISTLLSKTPQVIPITNNKGDGKK